MNACWTQIRLNLRLAVPMMLGQLTAMSMGWIDSAMVGRGVGTTALAGLAFGVGVVHVAFICGFGLVQAVSVLVALAVGEGRPERLAEILRHGLASGLLYGVAIAVVITLGLDAARFFGQDPAVVAEARPYILYYAWSFVPTLLYANFRVFCEAQNRPWLPLTVLSGGVGLNVFLNWLLIYGHWGMPRWGLAGAGLATLLSHLASLVVLATIVLRDGRLHADRSIFRLDRLNRARLLEVWHLGGPTAAQIFLEVATFVLAAIMMGWIGPQQLAAHQVAIQMAGMSFMVPLGHSFAVAIRIGQARGAGQLGEIRAMVGGALFFAVAFMGLTAVGFIAGRHLLPQLFSKDPAVWHLASVYLVVCGLFQVFDGLQVTCLGILRGHKDVQVPALLLMAGYWLLCLPTAWLLGFPLGLEGLGIWIGLLVGLAVVATALLARVRWILGRAPPNPQAA